MTRVGTFVKTGSPQVIELLGLSGLDFAVIDAEHAPFDRPLLDFMLLAGRAAQLPLWVRVPDATAATIGAALDMGAAGVIVPHVDTPAQAAQIARLAKFHNGERGFSNSARFGRYGTTTITEAITLGDATQVICQIESAEAVANAELIAATIGVAGLLVGRADLALSLGLTDLKADAVVAGTRRTIEAARRADKIAAIVVGAVDEQPSFLSQGAKMFIVGSDQSILRTGATSIATLSAQHIQAHRQSSSKEIAS